MDESYIEFDLTSVSECALIVTKIFSLNADRSLSNVFEDEAGKTNEQRGTEVSSHTSFHSHLIEKVLEYKLSTIEKLSLSIEGGLNHEIFTSRPTFQSLTLVIKSSLMLSK